MVLKVCKICGKDFTDNTKSQTQIYCSPECRKESIKLNLRRRRHGAEKIHRTCKECGKVFTVSGKHIYYCSNECLKKSALVKVRRYNKEKRAGTWVRKQVRSREVFVPNRCMICGGEIPDRERHDIMNYVICESCVPLTKFRVEPERIYHGIAKNPLVKESV